MKKVLLFALFLFLFGWSMAQEQTGSVQVKAKIDGSKFNEANTDISQINIDFCDKVGAKSIEHTLPRGGKQDICIEIGNSSDKDVEINIGFVDGTFTNDQRKRRACLQQGEDKNFGQYVHGFSSSLIVPANGSITQHANFQAPKEYTGDILGCLVYYTKGIPAGVWEGPKFSILMRKAKFIDIHITSQTIKSAIFGGNVQSKWGILLLIVLTGIGTLYLFKKSNTTKKTSKPHSVHK